MEVLEFLLENDADVDVVDKDGWKPIHAAACWGNVNCLLLYLICRISTFFVTFAINFSLFTATTKCDVDNFHAVIF